MCILFLETFKLYIAFEIVLEFPHPLEKLLNCNCRDQTQEKTAQWDAQKLENVHFVHP